MNKTGIETKVSLLLNPSELKDLFTPLDTIHVTIKGKIRRFERFPISAHALGKFFNHLSDSVQDLLLKFEQEDIAFQLTQIKKRRLKERGGGDIELFLRRAGMRYINDQMRDFAASCSDLRLYHSITNKETGNKRITACTLSIEIPRLSFKIVKDDFDFLHVIPIIDTDTLGTLTLDEFEVHEFLLLKNDVYYQLKHEDWLQLENLRNKNIVEYADKPALFLEKIVNKLEEKYRVDRGDCFENNTIAIIPENAILLNEISDSFLMIMPRWYYDGFLIEGKYQPIFETTKNGQVFTIQRDEAQEKAFLQYIQALHPNFQKQNNGHFYLSFSEAKKKQWFLKAYHKLISDNVSILGLDMLKHFRYSEFAVQTNWNVIEEINNTVVISIEVLFGKEKISIHTIKKILLEQQATVLLKDNTIGVFTDEWLLSFGVLIKHAQVNENKITVAKWLFVSLSIDDNKASLIYDLDWKNKWMQWQSDAKVLIELPSAINATLRPYQQKGFEWLVLLSEIGSGALLADDMGLGKTLQTIAFLAYRQERFPNKKQLVVTPASLVYNWKQEIERFFDLATVYIHGGSNRNIESFYESDATIMICSYGALRNDIESIQTNLWDVIVLDECHNIKNIQSQNTKAVQQLQGSAKVALSGTPVMNGTFDLYAPFQFLLPGYLGGQEFFRKEYVYPIDREMDTNKVHLLQQITAPFILRRKKDDVAKDLPEKVESYIWCEMDEDQRNVYDLVKSEIKDSLFLGIQTDGLNKNKLGVLQGIQKLRQICASPTLIKDRNFSNQSVKIEILIEEIKGIPNKKVLVFSQFKGMLDALENRFQQDNISYYRFDGDTAPEKRIELVNAFQNEEDATQVFLISLKAGNAGITLTAAEYVYLMDPWWNNAVQQQAIDRTHRIGQQKSVFAYKLICKDSIEEKVVKLQQKKKQLSEELIIEDEGFVKSLTEEDVAYLFD
jgi:SNF2 family DNA or RNA helicase